MRNRTSIVTWAATGAAAVGIALAVAPAPATTGCTTHQCDSSARSYDGGRMIDENTYETNPIDQSQPGDPAWLDYPGNLTLTVTYDDKVAQDIIGGRAPISIMGYAGLSPQPNRDPNSNFIVAVGQLAEITSLTSKGFTVNNATCAHYFARFEVHFPAIESDGGGTDGTARTDAATE